METVKVLHLFPRLLSLYGEYGNLKLLQKQAADFGAGMETDAFESGDLRLSDYQMVYIGAGTERAVELAAARLLPYKEEIRAYIENGGLLLCTGTATALFGERIVCGEKETETLGIFGYETSADPTVRLTGDVLTNGNTPFGASLLGYVNTSYTYTGEMTPVCRFVLGKELGSNKKTPEDGHLYKNFIATQITGPLLVKNPAAAEYYLTKLLGRPCVLPEESNVKKAYASALRELSACAEQ